MPDKKKKSAGRNSQPKKKTTAKRRTALPVSAARATSKDSVSKQPVMRLVVPPPELVEPSHEMIAKRSFENWMMYLRMVNDPVQNWIEAESQLRRELNPE